MRVNVFMRLFNVCCVRDLVCDVGWSVLIVCCAALCACVHVL